MDDRARVAQPPMIVDRRHGSHTLSGPIGLQIPSPPVGCESEQLLDWAAIRSSVQDTGLDGGLKLRIANAYAVKWSVPLLVHYPGGRVETESATPEG